MVSREFGFAKNRRHFDASRARERSGSGLGEVIRRGRSVARLKM
jgi:hypothetical protein